MTPAPRPIGSYRPIASVEVQPSGWGLFIEEIVTAMGLRYNAILVAPEGSRPLVMSLWPDLEHVFESVATFLARQGLPNVATALRAAVYAETRE